MAVVELVDYNLKMDVLLQILHVNYSIVMK